MKTHVFKQQYPFWDIMKLHVIYGIVWTLLSVVVSLLSWKIGIIMFMETVLLIFYVSRYEALKKKLEKKIN